MRGEGGLGGDGGGREGNGEGWRGEKGGVMECVDGGGKERRSHIAKQTLFVRYPLKINNKQINDSSTMPFSAHSREHHSGEHSGVNSGIHQNFTRMENTGIIKLAGPSAKFHSTGMTRFLQK